MHIILKNATFLIFNPLTPSLFDISKWMEHLFPQNNTEVVGKTTTTRLLIPRWFPALFSVCHSPHIITDIIDTFSPQQQIFYNMITGIITSVPYITHILGTVQIQGVSKKKKLYFFPNFFFWFLNPSLICIYKKIIYKEKLIDRKDHWLKMWTVWSEVV